MNHPILVAALAEDRRSRCLCGAVAQQGYGLCRDCRAVVVWRQETSRTKHRALPSWTYARIGKARLFAPPGLLLHLISGKAENLCSPR